MLNEKQTTEETASTALIRPAAEARMHKMEAERAGKSSLLAIAESVGRTYTESELHKCLPLQLAPSRKGTFIAISPFGERQVNFAPPAGRA